MKVVFVGGGAHRLFGILRKALADHLLCDGEIYLLDLDLSRAEAMGRLLEQTPEYARAGCRIAWGNDLDTALDGADAVGVVLMGGSMLSFRLGDVPAWKYRYDSSDNVSPNGAFLAMKAAPILMKIARRMEKICPDAWLINFANPIAPLVGMLRQFTSIKAVGVCAGYTNHQWDLNRLLGRDEWSDRFQVTVAGVNHLSYILNGQVDGEDLFDALQCVKRENWKVPPITTAVSEAQRRSIEWGVNFQAEIFRDLGVLVFSTEGDGQCHLRYDDQWALQRKDRKAPSSAEIRQEVAAAAAQRTEANAAFLRAVSEAADPRFWENQPSNSLYQPVKCDIFVRFLQGLGSAEGVEVVTTQPNGKSIANLPANAMIEASQIISKSGLRPKREELEIPPVVYGLSASLSMHQTLLGEACGAEDPQLLAKALLSYPVRPYSNELKSLYHALLEINRDEIPAAFRNLDQELRLY